VQLSGDLLVRIASRDVAKDLALSRRQVVEVLVDRRRALTAARALVREQSGQETPEDRQSRD
jgi:hypothetical protein